MNAQRHLATDLQRRVEKHVQGMTDDTLAGILDRHDTVVAAAALDFLEHIGNRRHRNRFHGMSKMLERGRLGKRTFRPEKGHTQRQLERQAFGHDLAKQARHRFTTQRTGIAHLHLAQHLCFAFRAIEHGIGI